VRRPLPRILVWFISVLALLLVCLAVLGGGWGPKPPLPAAFVAGTRPILLAHRGLVGRSPENTEAAVADAVDAGYDGVELDIQSSADGQFIAFHDETTDRLLGHPGSLSLMSMEEISRERLFSSTDRLHSIPMLRDILERYSGRAIFYLDMKRHGHSNIFSLASDICRVVDDAHAQERVMVASAYPWFIAWLEFRHPEIITVLEGANHPMMAFWDFIPRNFKPDLIASRYPDLEPGLFAEMRERGLDSRYVAYHVDESNIHPALAMGVRILLLDHGPTVDSLLLTDSREP